MVPAGQVETHCKEELVAVLMKEKKPGAQETHLVASWSHCWHSPEQAWQIREVVFPKNPEGQDCTHFSKKENKPVPHTHSFEVEFKVRPVPQVKQEEKFKQEVQPALHL
ncbi:MAG: hypothetical protein Q8L84_17125 [Hyphomonas sp.]|nr:hypothetical protein [Hyphomonas sp.]